MATQGHCLAMGVMVFCHLMRGRRIYFAPWREVSESILTRSREEDRTQVITHFLLLLQLASGAIVGAVRTARVGKLRHERSDRVTFGDDAGYFARDIAHNANLVDVEQVVHDGGDQVADADGFRGRVTP